MTLFFELIQVALGQRSELSRVPSEGEWLSLLSEARRQALTGILFGGVEQLPPSQRPPEELLFQWLVLVQDIEDRNAKLDSRCLMLLRKFEEVGLRVTILKGRGIARLYGPMANRRQCGDIDLFVDGGLENALRKMPKVKKNVWGYKHVELQIWKDTEVEMHYHVECINSIRRNRRLQKWFEAHKEDLFHRDGEWVTPTLEMNLFYILLHIYRHFFYQGIGLRQMVDYYYCLKAAFAGGDGRLPGASAGYHVEAVRAFGMERFAHGLMWAMGEVLALPREWMPWTPDEQEGRFILEQMMAGGNLGLHTVEETGRQAVRPSAPPRKKHRTLHRALHLMRRYPEEAFPLPFWAVYNRTWKLVHWLRLLITYNR